MLCQAGCKEGFKTPASATGHPELQVVTIFFMFCYILVLFVAPLLLETAEGWMDLGSDPAQWLL